MEGVKKARLGGFIAGGILLFVVAVFVIGKQKHLFSPVFRLTANFRNISGLQVGNNVRFSGINVGTVDNINMVKINNGNGVLGKFIQDSAFAETLNQTMENLRKGSKSLDENMEAAKHNFLLRGYFNKKEKEAKQKQEEEKKRKEKEEAEKQK